jgi:hypothetical protein
MATLKVATRFTKEMVLTKTSWPVISNDKYFMVEEALKLAM